LTALQKLRMRRVEHLSVQSYKKVSLQASGMVMNIQLDYGIVTNSREGCRDVAAR
jgi:hypothetical protein